MDRRSFVGLAVASTVAMAAGVGRTQETDSGVPQNGPCSGDPQTCSQKYQVLYPEDDKDLKDRWVKLDAAIWDWWQGDLHHADEEAIRNDPAKTLLFLPFPYITPGGSHSSFPEMYGWDTQFINMGLIEHARFDIARWNMLDQLFMIERYGVVLGSSRNYCVRRGQPPLLAWSIENYLNVKKDDDELAMLAYPLLERSYTDYWNGEAHATPIGLTTCRTPECTDWPAEMSGEGEAGLDFTPIFDGHIGQCVPIHVNCALVKQAQVLAMLAERFGWSDKATRWKKEADLRAQRINQYCWDEDKGCYMEYNYVQKKRLPYYSLNAYWPLWVGIASKSQAQRVVGNLKMFDQPYGLTFTDKAYPNPHPEFHALEWAYPESWPNQQMIVALALQRYGFNDEARKINLRYIGNVVTTWEKSGLLWERYNAVDGAHMVPNERHEPRPLHGWTSASAVVLGRMLFGEHDVAPGTPATAGV